MGGNVPEGPDTVATTRESQMRAFDQLPRTARQLLAFADDNIDSVGALRLLEKFRKDGNTHDDFIAIVRYNVTKRRKS